MEVILPLLAVKKSCAIHISTPLGPENPFSKMLYLKNKDGEPLYNVVHVAMVCDDCKKTKPIDEQHKCKHATHKIPPWKSQVRQLRNTEIAQQLDKDQNRNLREGFGIVLGSSRTMFVREEIEFLFSSNRKKIQTMEVPSFILMSVDPNAGYSDMGIVTGYFRSKAFSIDPTACLFEAVLLSVDGYQCKGRLMHADQMNLVLSHASVLRNRFPSTHIILVIENQTGSTHNVIAEHLMLNLKNIYNPMLTNPSSSLGGRTTNLGGGNRSGTVEYLPEKGISIICQGLNEERIGVTKTKPTTEQYVYITNRYLKHKLIHWDQKCFTMRKDIFEIINNEPSSASSATKGAKVLTDIRLGGGDDDDNLRINIKSKPKIQDGSTGGGGDEDDFEAKQTNKEFQRVTNELRLQLLRIEMDEKNKIHGKQGGAHDDIAVAFMMFLYYGYLLLKPYPNPYLTYLPQIAIDEFLLYPKGGLPTLM